jgi:imidazolonepropionase-like amidohydrolase
MKKILRGVAGTIAVAVLLFFAAVYYPLSLPQPGERPELLLIRGATVIDPATDSVLQNHDILIAGDTIQALGQDLSAPGAHIIDARGRYAIPGLFDMHVHSLKLAPWLTHPLFIAAGVTAVRDMGGCIGIPDAAVACIEDKRRWQQEVGEGRLVAPRYDQVTSLAIDGGGEIPAGADPALGAGDAEGARLRVAFDASRGVDFLKPYSSLPREGYFTLAEAAQGEQLYLAGHKPMAVSGLEAVAAGQRSIEHAFLFIWECYPGMDTLRQAGDVRGAYTHEMRREMIEQHDPLRCAALQSAMAEAGTALVPTHTTRKLDAYALDESFRSDPRLRYIATPLRTLWLSDADGMAARTTSEGLASYREFYEFGIRQTGVAHRAGVTILAGTDAPDSFAFPGSGLHDELEHLAQAGLSPMEVLRAATSDPARFLDLEGQAGTVAAGARSDIVLLTDNPLEDINAVRNIDTVILSGAVYNRASLDRILQQVENNAGHWTLWPKFLWQLGNSPIMRQQFAD